MANIEIKEVTCFQRAFGGNIWRYGNSLVGRSNPDKYSYIIRYTIKINQIATKITFTSNNSLYQDFTYEENEDKLKCALSTTQSFSTSDADYIKVSKIMITNSTKFSCIFDNIIIQPGDYYLFIYPEDIAGNQNSGCLWWADTSPSIESASGAIHIYLDKLETAIPYIYDGEKLQQAIPYTYDGTNLQICS